MSSTLSDEDITTTPLTGATAALADPDGTDGDADGEDTGGDGAKSGDTVTDGDGTTDAD